VPIVVSLTTNTAESEGVLKKLLEIGMTRFRWLCTGACNLLSRKR